MKEKLLEAAPPQPFPSCLFHCGFAFCFTPSGYVDKPQEVEHVALGDQGAWLQDLVTMM